MTQHIDKAALVAEIDRRIKGLKDCHADTITCYAGEISGLKRLLSFLDTLEVKEVDLEEEIGKCLKKYNMFAVGKRDFTDIAKHFFELGLKAQKGGEE